MQQSNLASLTPVCRINVHVVVLGSVLTSE